MAARLSRVHGHVPVRLELCQYHCTHDAWMPDRQHTIEKDPAKVASMVCMSGLVYVDVDDGWISRNAGNTCYSLTEPPFEMCAGILHSSKHTRCAQSNLTQYCDAQDEGLSHTCRRVMVVLVSF